MVEEAPAVTTVVEAVVLRTVNVLSSPLVVKQSATKVTIDGVVSVEAAVIDGVVVA